MVIRLGNNEPNKLYVGTQEVQKIYRGSGLVWSAVPIDPSGGPQSSGSGLPAPTSWSVDNERAVTGDIMRLDVQSVPTRSGYVAEYFEVAILKNGELSVERVLGGPAVDYERRHRGVSGTNKVWLRTIYRDEVDYTQQTPSEWSSPKEVSLSNGSVRVEVTASKSNLIVGEGVYFEASVYGANTLRPLHDLRYRWYVTKSGEQGSFDALPDYFTKHFDNSRTEGYGSAWAFVPQTSGTTTVYCEVRDRSGVLATESITLTTTPATDVIAASDTYVVSTSGDYAGTPSGAQRFTDLDAACQAILANNDSRSPGNALVLLRSGETFDNSTDRFNRNQLLTMMVTSYGSGARPVLTNGFQMRSDTAIFKNVDFKSYYDPTDPMNMPNLGSGGLKFEDTTHATVADCFFSGHNVSVRVENNLQDGEDRRIVLSNVEITDWGNFGMLQGSAKGHALVGCYFHQNPRTWRGKGKGESSPPFLADHGPFRSSRVTANRVFSKVVGFSTNGWGGVTAVQPTFRLFGNGDTERPFRTTISEMISEGGIFSISVTSRGGGFNSATPQDIVIDKFVHITTTQYGAALTIDFGGTTMKNFILVQPNTLKESSTGMRHMIGLSNLSINVGEYDNENNPVVLVNGTLVDLRDSETNYKNRDFDPYSINGDHPLKDVTYENILEYAPEMPKGVTDTLPLDLSPNWTPEYIGLFDWEVGSPDFSTANKPENTATFAPKSGSSAYKSATGNLIPVDDLRGTLRSGNTSKGAFH